MQNVGAAERGTSGVAVQEGSTGPGKHEFNDYFRAPETRVAFSGRDSVWSSRATVLLSPHCGNVPAFCSRILVFSERSLDVRVFIQCDRIVVMSNTDVSLPSDFLQWLGKLPELHVARFKDNEWQFWTPDELQETTRVNRVATTQLLMMKGFVAMYREMGLTSAKGAAGKPFPYEQLERCLCLATDNEDYLVVDPEGEFSVWKFCPDYAKCGEVKPVAASLAQFQEGAVIEDAGYDDEY